MMLFDEYGAPRVSNHGEWPNGYLKYEGMFTMGPLKRYEKRPTQENRESVLRARGKAWKAFRRL